MPKSKTVEDVPSKAEPGPGVDVKPETPEKQGDPGQIMRAAQSLAQPEMGAPERARNMGEMQQSVGNTRAGQMLAKSQASKSSSPVIQLQQKGKEPAGSTSGKESGRQDVVVIVGRPSQTTPTRETPEEMEQMKTWRAAAHALSPVVLEGLKVGEAFAGLRKLNRPIGKLYIIGHADVSGIGEVGQGGEGISTTVEDLTDRMKKATGALGVNKPESVEMLSCFGGGSPRTMGQIGESLGAKKIRAPVQMTVISGRSIKINGKAVTPGKLQKMQEKELIAVIQKTDALKYYDFVPGVPHPQTPLSDQDKLAGLTGILRRTGMIPYISFNSAPGEHDAVPFWKARAEKKKKTDELSIGEQIVSKDLIEVDVQESAEDQ